MNKKVVIFFSLLAVIVISLIGYRLYVNSAKENKNAGPGPGGRSASGVYGMIVVSESFSEVLTLNGTLEANEIADIRPEISGLIESINFSEGSSVSSGQLLIKINDAELKAQLSQASTRSELAGENERRAKLLLEKEAISQEEYDIASADYRMAKSQIDLIKAQIRKTSIFAPFSGNIGLRNVSKGSYITPSDIIVQLVNTSRIKLQFSIPEKYANLIKEGMNVDFSVQGISQVFKAKVYAKEPIIDPLTRTLTIRAITDNVNNSLIPGAFANVIFPMDEVKDAILIPTEALIPIQNGKKIFVQKNGKAKEVLVETGSRTDSTTLITKGLQVGDTVLTSGVMSLRDGSAVKVNLR